MPRSRQPGPARVTYGILQEAGGVAAARYLADQLSARMGQSYGVREVRDLLRNYRGIRKLGAGYYALGESEMPSVDQWVTDFVEEQGRHDDGDVANAVLETYPHGSRRGVLAWLAQTR